jgi:hypothetical protein
VAHQIGVQTQGLPTVCCLCTTQISRTTSLGRARVTMSEHLPEGRLDRAQQWRCASDVPGFDRHEQFLGCRAEQLGAPGGADR